MVEGKTELPGERRRVHRPHDWGADLNLRHVPRKQNYVRLGQFPIERYVLV